MKINFLLSLLCIALLLASCTKHNDDDPVLEGPGAGILIINEGPFMSGSGTVTFHGETVIDNLFESVNHRPLGNILHSYTEDHAYGWLVVNNADKIEVVDKISFISVATIGQLSYPRHVTQAGNGVKAVSEWTGNENGRVSFVSEAGFSVLEQVETGPGPDNMMVIGEELWVLNTGGFGSGHTISIIHLPTRQLTATLEVCDNPNSIQEVNGAIWLMCGGRKVYNPDFTLNEEESTHGALVLVAGGNIQTLWTSPEKSDRPYDLTLAGGEAFFLMNGDIYRTDQSGSAAQLLRAGNYYTLSTGRNSTLFATDPADYTSPGFVDELHSGSGEIVHQFSAGIIPRQVVVKAE